MKVQKSLKMAIFLNCLLPGGGYIYMERVFLGIVAFVLAGSAIFRIGFTAWFVWMAIMVVDMILLKKKKEKSLSNR